MTRKFRILHTNYGLSYGGIQEVIRVLVKFSDSSRFEHVVVAPLDGPLRSAYEVAGAKVVLAGEDQILAVAQQEQVDVVITHTINGTDPWSHRHAYHLDEKGIPLVAYLHCSFLCQAPLEMFQAVITPSESNWRLLGKPDLNMIPHGIDHISVQPTAEPMITKERLGFSNETLLIGRVSRLEDSKLIAETIKAMAQLKQSAWQQLGFVIAGGESIYVQNELGPGHYLDGLKGLAQFSGLTNNELIFTGSVSQQEKADLLGAIDIYLSPSSVEGYGIVFCEAMANGVPVITYDDHANRETVGEGGIVVEFGNLEELVEASLQLVEKPDLRESIGLQGRHLVQTRNEPHRYAQQVEGVLLLDAIGD